MSEKIQLGGRYFFYDKHEQFASGIVDHKPKICTFVVIKILKKRVIASYNKNERTFKKSEWTALTPVSKKRLSL